MRQKIVENIEAAMMIIEATKNWPMTGRLAGIGGVCWDNWSMKTTIARRIVISREKSETIIVDFGIDF